MKSNYNTVEKTYLYRNSKGIFHAITGLEDDIADIRDHCICEIDELIAYPVVELCNKGYLTKYCCSGHGFGNLKVEPIEVEYKEGMFDDVVEVKYSDSVGANLVCTLGAPNHIAYISFEDTTRLPSIPNGWYPDKNSIYFNIEQTGNPIEYYKSLLRGLELLMSWIETLPNVNN